MECWPCPASYLWWGGGCISQCEREYPDCFTNLITAPLLCWTAVAVPWAGQLDTEKEVILLLFSEVSIKVGTCRAGLPLLPGWTHPHRFTQRSARLNLDITLSKQAEKHPSIPVASRVMPWDFSSFVLSLWQNSVVYLLQWYIPQRGSQHRPAS